MVWGRISFVITFAIISQTATAQPMRYEVKKGQDYQYDVEVTIGSEKTSETRTGQLTYVVTHADTSGFELTQTGLLKRKFTKGEFQNLTTSVRGFSFFRPSTSSITHVTRFDRFGRVMSRKGVSQPATAVGFAPDLVVEVLNFKGTDPWTITRASTIEYTTPYVTPRATRYLNNIYPCQETLTFREVSRTPQGITLAKTYACVTIDAPGGKPHISISAKGQVVLDPKTHLPISGNLTGEVICSFDMSVIKVPFSQSFRRLDARQLAEIEAQKRQAADAAAADAATRSAGIARLRMLDTPTGKELSTAEITNVLTDLKAPDSKRRGDALEKLARAKPTSNQAIQVLDAIMRVPSDRNDSFIFFARSAAEKTWKRAAALAGPKPSKAQIKALIAKMYSSDLGDSWDAIEALGFTDDTDAACALANGLANSRTKIHAAKALRQIGSIAAPFVAKHLTSQDWTVRSEAADILIDIGTKAELKALVRAKADTNGLVRNHANAAITAIQAKSSK